MYGPSSGNQRPPQSSSNSYGTSVPVFFGGGSGSYGVEGRLKQPKKPASRRTVDISISIINTLATRKYARDFRDMRAVNPHSLYRRFALTPGATLGDNANVFTTKLTRTSMNKQRNPVNCVTFNPSGRRVITGNMTGYVVLRYRPE